MLNLAPLFDCYPELTTERLLLCKPSSADVDGVFAYASDPDVAEFTTWYPHQTRADSIRAIEAFLTTHRMQSGVTWLLKDRATSEVLGSLVLTVVPRHLRAEVGYALKRTHWGQGLMTEAVKAVLAFGFETLGLNRIEARCNPNNRGSARVMEKAGMHYEGLLRQSVVIKNEPHDHCLYAILRSDWT